MSGSDADAKASGSQRGLHAAVGFTFGGNLAALGFGLLATAVVARTLGPADYGVFGLSTAVSLIALELAGRGLNRGFISLYAEHSVERPGFAAALLRGFLRIKAIGSLVLLVASPLIAAPLARAWSGDERWAAALGFGLAFAAFQSLWEAFQSVLEARRAFLSVAAQKFAVQAVRFAAIAGCAWAALLDLRLALALGVASQAVGAAAGFLGVRRRREPAPEPGNEASRRLFRFGKWTLASGVLYASYSRLDVFALGAFRSTEEVGHYNAALILVVLFDYAAHSAMTVLLPRVSSMRRADEYVRYVRQALRLSALLAIGLLPLWFLAGPLLGLVYGAGYDASVPLFRILFFGNLVSLLAAPPYLVLYARGRPEMMTFHDVFILCVSAAAQVVAVPRAGAEGAAAVVLGVRLLSAAIVSAMVFGQIRATRGEEAGGAA